MFVAGALITNDQGWPLLLQRKSSSVRNPGQWELPGGKVKYIDPWERRVEAVIREVREELGVDVKVGALLGVCMFQIPELTFQYTWYQATILNGGVPSIQEPDKHSLLEYFNPEWHNTVPNLSPVVKAVLSIGDLST